MNSVAKLSQSDMEALQSRKQAIAARWYDAIAPTIAELNAGEVKSQLAEWTSQAILLLSTDSLERGTARAIGEGLARDISAEPVVLGRTQEVLAHQTASQLPAEQAAALLPHLIGLLAEIAVGFGEEQGKHVKTMRRKFLSTTSHDMRSPLNAIIGFSRIMAKGIDGPVTDIQAQDLGTIHDSGRALLKMIDDVFNIDKVEAGSVELDLKAFILTDVINGAVETVRPLIDENENFLEARHGELPGQIHSDPAKIKQILVNLLSRAAATTKQGTVTLNVSYSASDGTDWLQFQVSDTGLGMTPTQIERFAAAGSPETLQYDDITLMVSQRLCQLLGGEIAVESETNKGATFTFRLPLRPTGR
jgi:signal transduction histidine kinase